MAEPLLKRTFSRLRGKDRSHRKTKSKLSDDPDKVTSSCSTQRPSPLTAAAGAPPPSDRPSPSRDNITVTKKQHWVKQGSVSLSPCPTPRSFPWDHPSGISQDAPGAPCPTVSSTAVLQEASQSAGGSTDVQTTSISTKRSGQRAYLQSLDRSSRAWVLSSGKSQASEDVCDRLEDRSSNIWYNPIPEEEDAPNREVGRRREQRPGEEASPGRVESEDARGEEGAVRTTEPNSEEHPLEGANPSVCYCSDDITAERTDPPASDHSPASQKKGSISSSMIDRLKSPGTVRKLSQKMKKLPELRRKLSLRSSRAHRQGDDGRGGGDECGARNVSSNQNVISRYHLDSSAPPTHSLRQSLRGRSVSKGGHLSDGDSPELLPRPQGPRPVASQEMCDVSSFRLYLDPDPPRCSQRVTGLLTVHLLGLEEMKTRSEGSKEVFLAIQVDGVTRARTALLNLQRSALSLNHTFHLELEQAGQLRIVVLTPANLQTGCVSKPGSYVSQASCGPASNRVCGVGRVSIPSVFKGSRNQQLCVKLEPRGLLYVKLSLHEKWDKQFNTHTSPVNVFGVELHHLVEKEASAAPVPLLIQKAVAEIERRGLKVVGLYRLCGSAAVKKELRDWFERNSSAVCLGEDLYPDINVITGILKDYLRELPSPLITRTLYQVVRDTMSLRPLPTAPDPRLAQSTVELLSCLLPPERATLSLLLDHLSLVASFSSYNRMNHQNLAVCFGPVLLTPTQEAWRAGGGGGKGARVKGFSEEMANAVDFKRHIEALHYLLQQWPVPVRDLTSDSTPPSPTLPHHPLGQRRPVLRLALPQNPEGEVVVSRRGRGGQSRLESPPPINRYAGDWSVCGQDLLLAQEADYDEVAGSDSDRESGDEEVEKKDVWCSGGGDLYVDDFLDFDAPFNCRLSLKDFDNLIHDLDRELAKHINICL